jgi:hypothetical protein
MINRYWRLAPYVARCEARRLMPSLTRTIVYSFDSGEPPGLALL